MPNKISNITNNTKDAIKRKSAYSLPDRPSDQGMKPDEIKRAFWQPIADVTYSSLAEIDRVINEINNVFNASYDAHLADANNPHSVTKAQIGLGNCDNTADADKPLSFASRAAIDYHDLDTMAHKKIRDAITNSLALKSSIADIQDTFISTAADKPLSAYRGKILFDSLQTTDGKAEQSIKSISLNSVNGVLTITKTNGTISTIDLPLEYMVQSGRYDALTKNIVLELAGGTTIEIPAAAIVNEYYGDNSTVTAYTDTADGNKVKFKLSDTVLEKVDSNTNARHSHANKAILEATNAAFTTSLKTTYDGYSLPISENTNAISAEITARQKEITRVENVITTKQGTVVTVGGFAQNAIAFNSDPQTEIDGKLDKLMYQYNVEIQGGSVIHIGSFPVEDTNITVDISSTADKTYNARLIVACQNFGTYSATTYGDSADSITPYIRIKPSSASDKIVDIYYVPKFLNRTAIEIKCVGTQGIPTHICRGMHEVPANATIMPENSLAIKENAPIVLYDRYSSDPNINWGHPNGIYGGVEITNKDFTPYKYLMAYATHNNGDVNFVTIINTINANANYTASSSNITAVANLQFQEYKMTNNSIIANRVGYYQNIAVNNFTVWEDRSITGLYYQGYYIYKIEGVLK